MQRDEEVVNNKLIHPSNCTQQSMQLFDESFVSTNNILLSIGLSANLGVKQLCEIFQTLTTNATVESLAMCRWRCVKFLAKMRRFPGC
jgi:hypothetical protein